MYKMEIYIDGSFSGECSAELKELLNEIDELYKMLNSPDFFRAVYAVEICIFNEENKKVFNNFSILFNEKAERYELRSDSEWQTRLNEPF